VDRENASTALGIPGLLKDSPTPHLDILQKGSLGEKEYDDQASKKE